MYALYKIRFGQGCGSVLGSTMNNKVENNNFWSRFHSWNKKIKLIFTDFNKIASAVNSNFIQQAGFWAKINQYGNLILNLLQILTNRGIKRLLKRIWTLLTVIEPGTRCRLRTVICKKKKIVEKMKTKQKIISIFSRGNPYLNV